VKPGRILSLTEIIFYPYFQRYENSHYAGRYEQNKLGIYGCFGSKDTAIFRHHDPDHFSQIFSAWKQLRKETRAGKTLSENQINITQLLYKKG
jgi:hypothetical protein